MKHYLNPETNDIYAYESDGSQDDLIPDTYKKLSDKELIKIREKHQAELEAQAKLKFDALPYQEKRKSEYPPIENYLDAIVKNDKQQLQKYIDDCLAVKEKYPKE